MTRPAPDYPSPPTAASARETATLVVDAGAYTLKAGLVPAGDASEKDTDCAIIPNCIARSRTKQTYIGSALSKCPDFGEMQFKRPLERGYIVNWDLERAIFEHEFFDSGAALHCDPSTTSLLLTEPPNAPAALSSNTDQIIFEEFNFSSAARVNPAVLNSLNPLLASLASARTSPLPTEILLLIDCGHSSTTITPLLRGHPIQAGIRRLAIGGKHISNHLAELISLRHFSLMEEPHLVAEIKETACFISADFATDLERTWRGTRQDRRTPSSDIVRQYVLPDYTTRHHGTLLPAAPTTSGARPTDPSQPPGAVEDSFPLANERFTPPELLFSGPALLSLPESSLPQTIMTQVLPAVPRALYAGLLGNVLCTGGTALLPGFTARLEAELRALAPAEMEVRVARAEDPITDSWKGGRELVRREGGRWWDALKVSREEYLEYGEGWVRREMGRRRVVSDWKAERERFDAMAGEGTMDVDT